MKQNTIYGVILALLVVILGSFGVTQAYAQPLSCTGCPQISGLPTTTNEDVQSRMLDVLNTWFPQIVQQLEWQNGNLTKIINQQQEQINTMQAEIEQLKSIPQQMTQETCHKQGTGIICG